MKLIKKLLPEIWVFPILLFTFLLTRLITIMSVPIFTDEAIYTRWAQIARFDSAWRFISLTDGKQPSFVWLDMVFMKFVEDPLLAGRLVSVVAGFFVIVGVYFLTVEIFKKLPNARFMGIISLIIAVFFPFSLVYDRLAIYESLVAAFFVWTIYFQIRLLKLVRFDHALILGFVYGGAVLTKSIGFLSIYFSPLLLILFNFAKKERRERVIKVILYFSVATILAFAFYSILRLSPFYHVIEEKNSNFVYPVSEWLKFTFDDKVTNFISNLQRLFEWFYIYFTIPYIFLSVYSFFVGKKVLKEKTVLFLWFLLPFLALSVVGKNIYPRYVFFMVIPLIPLVSFSMMFLLEKFKNLATRILILLFSFAMPLYASYFIIFDFPHSPIPNLDLEQYINGWPAGGGISESIKFFNEKSKDGQIFVATQGTFGLLPSSYEIYLLNNKRVTIKGYWPVDNDKLPNELIKNAEKMPTYFVFYQPCQKCEYPGKAPDALNLEKIVEYKKGIGSTYLTIYRVGNSLKNE